jgi:hypothetical protein
VFKSVQANKIPVLPLVPLGAAAYAVFNYFVNSSDHTVLITICLVMGELIWAVASAVRSYLKEG